MKDKTVFNIWVVVLLIVWVVCHYIYLNNLDDNKRDIKIREINKLR